MAAIQDWSSLATPDPEWEQAVKEKMGGRTPDLGMFPDIATLRTWIIESKRAMSAQMGSTKLEGVKEHDEQVPMRDGSKITCRIYSPENPPAGGSPLFVMYHGGGFCIGGLENEELQCRLLVNKLGMVAVNVDYRLAPEYKFPIPVHDCHDATKWSAANASSLGADPSKGFIIGGTSAGGNLAINVALLFRDEKIAPPITGCLLMIPAVCDHAYLPQKYKADCTSWDQNENAPILSRKAVDLFIDNYIPNKEGRNNPLFSVLLWETGHKNFPPSVFQIAGQDPLRDEALIFERLLREDLGITTKVEVYPGQPHGFHSLAPTMKASAKFVSESVSGVQWLLEQV